MERMECSTRTGNLARQAARDGTMTLRPPVITVCNARCAHAVFLLCFVSFVCVQPPTRRRRVGKC